MLKVGDRAPELGLLNQKGETVNLSFLAGKKAVIYFYPKDHTPGCTSQACAFRDAYDGFKKLDVEVIGISKDTTKSHINFIEDYDLPFTLLSDTDGRVVNDYGVFKETKMFGKLGSSIQRATFVIDENAVVIKVFEKANPDTNASEILEFLRN